MRLTCPNCNAIYEVDENVIPVGGRDVQCSNCGQSWFQHGAGHAPDKAPTDNEPPAVKTAPEPDPIPAPASDAPPEDDTEDGDDFSDDFISPQAADTGRNDPITAATIAAARAGKEQQRRTLDDSLLAVLREEAELETRARKAEGSTLETQPELGLERAPAPKPVTAKPNPVGLAARLPEDPDTEPEPDLRPQRRQLLPDIEVINSTLVATSDRGAEPASRDAPETLARRRAGFQTGFLLAVLIAMVGFGVYLLAPRISTALPAAKPVLTAYVAQVDRGRIWLDDKLREMTEAMQRTPEN